jgi:excisionase family DNA binding protein
MLNVSRSTIYRMIGAKQLRAVKVGVRTIIPIASLNAILEGDER